MREASICRKAYRLLAVLALALTATGCNRGGEGQLAAEQTVRAYAEALVPALYAETLDPLRSVATTAQADRVRLYVVQLLEQDGVRVRARLTSMEVDTVQIEDGSASVTTNEDWTYVEQDRKSGRDVSRKEFKGQVVYHLVFDQERNRWLVESIDSDLEP